MNGSSGAPSPLGMPEVGCTESLGDRLQIEGLAAVSRQTMDFPPD